MRMNEPIRVISIVTLAMAFQAAAGDNYYSRENLIKFAGYCFQHCEYERAIGEYLRAAAEDGDELNDDSLFLRISVAYIYLSKPERARYYSGRIARESDDSSAVMRARYLVAFSYYLEERYDSAAVLSGLAASACGHGELRNLAGRLHVASLLKSYRWNEAVIASENKMSEAVTGTDDTLMRYLHTLGCRGNALGEKKPLVASTLSALVPGSGKVYACRAGDGFFSFLVIGTMAWQAYEGYAKGGIRSARCIVFGLLGFSFYAGNVYGSFNAALHYNQSRRQTLANRVTLTFDW